MAIPIQLNRPPARSRGLLLDAAQQIPADAYLADRGQLRWPKEGVTWNPHMYLLAETEEAQCDTVYDKQPTDLEGPVTQPAFLLWASLQCTVLSGVTDLLNDELNYSLDELRSAAFAAELETGAASGGLGLVGDATYTPTIVGSGAGSLAYTLAELEAYLADALNGAVGMIHMTPGLLALAAAEDLVFWDDGHYWTPTGHVVVGDAGFTGVTGPEGESNAGTDEAWIYASSMVWYDETAVSGSSTFGADPGGFDFGRNVEKPLKERHGILVFDPEVLAAGLVDAAAVGSSGGGGGDASAANQTTIIGHVDGIETLLNPTLVVEEFAADESIAAANYLHGYTVRETGDAEAAVTIHHGSANTDPVVCYINLAAGESVPLTMLARRVPCPNGIYVEVESGAVEGSIVYEA